MTLIPGVTRSGSGMDDISWNILGKTCVPKPHSKGSMSWHATLPMGTFVPPDIHPTQDKFIYVLDGRLDLLLNGVEVHVEPGDLIRLPMGVPRGVFNKTPATIKCLFRVAPPRRLFDLFRALHDLGPQADPADVVAISAQHEVAREVGVGINVLPHAIWELVALGLLPALDRTGVRTRHLSYLTRQGQEVWSELRGLHASHDVPQFSIHRGRLQKPIFDAVVDRLGPGAVLTGRRLAGFVQDEGGVTAHFTDSVEGGAGMTARGDVLVCADGIQSQGRRTFYPDNGAPRWWGVAMWPAWLDGESMAIGGGLDARFVLHPIAPPCDGRQLTNWVVNVRIKDAALYSPMHDRWARQVSLATVLPYAGRFRVPDMDIEGLVRATPSIFEYPMADRDLLPLRAGDFVGGCGASNVPGGLERRVAGHPRRALPRGCAGHGGPPARGALHLRGGPPFQDGGGGAGQSHRRTGARHRRGEKARPRGIADIDRVLSHADRKAIVSGHATMAGYAKVSVAPETA